MSARKALLILAAAMVVALAISLSWKPRSYVEQLIHVQAEQELGHIDNAILDEPLEVQGVLLDYAVDKELVLKAWMALSKHPKETREILLLYGSEAEFKEILRKYGDSVIPVIQYFRDNDVWSVKVMEGTGKVVTWFSQQFEALWNRVTRNAQQQSNPVAKTKPPELASKDKRGWYAVNFIRHEGHDLLGQFVIDKDNKVKRIQIERLLEAITSFFTSGLRTLEIKHDLGEPITTLDYFWAGLDVAVIAVPLRLFRAGKVVAGSGKELSLTTRTRLFAPRLLSKTKIFQKLGKYSAVAATAYIIVTNPSLINSVFGEIAKLLGLPPWLGQFAGWFLIVVLVLYPLSWILKPLARFILFGLSWLEHSRKKAIRKLVPIPVPT
jgi:hypothetical protein